MLMPQSHRRAICTALFTEGVLIAKKDFNAKKHVNIPGVTNLEVIKALQSLNSRGFVRTKFSWQYYYYFLTAEGVAHLREYLHLPEAIVPKTMIKDAPAPAPAAYPRREQSDRFAKKEAAPGDHAPVFRGGVSRPSPAAAPRQ